MVFFPGSAGDSPNSAESDTHPNSNGGSCSEMNEVGYACGDHFKMSVSTGLPASVLQEVQRHPERPKLSHCHNAVDSHSRVLARDLSDSCQ